MGQDDPRDQVEYLKALLALAVAVGLGVAYVLGLNPAGGIGELLTQAIPSALVLLVGGVLVYFILHRRGVLTRNAKLEGLLDRVESNLSSMPLFSSTRYPQLREFFETYRDVDWKRLLTEHVGRLDIIVYYFDSWVNANYESLVEFFRKPKTSCRVFVADPENPETLATIQRLFPEYDETTIRGKVSRTGERIAGALKEAGGPASRLRFYYVPHILNYSAQCLDDRTLCLSVFEMNREQKIDSPAILIDLSKSAHLAAWWKKEIEGLGRGSVKQKV